MLTQFFNMLDQADAFFWGYIGFTMIILLGCYFTLRTGFFQIRVLPTVIRTFIQFLGRSTTTSAGTHPLKVFFASVGGMIGVGNVVGIVTALQLGGPGALFWVWVAAFFGMVIKYSEVYLGLRFRVANSHNGYDGGPMYYVGRAFSATWVPPLICLLLCIYGAEIYQFSVIVETVSNNWSIDRIFVVPILLLIVLYASKGGVQRVAKICSWMMPVFIVSYIVMCLWVIGHHLPQIPTVLMMVVKSAFTGHAALGGFVGSTMMLAIQNGMAGACYSADIGIGYDSIIQSESRTVYPERQARMALLGVCVDNVICTMSVLVVLVTGIWHDIDIPKGTVLVQAALEQYFPHVSYIMPIFIFILAYTTLIAYLSVGLKCARFLHPTRGRAAYLVYTVVVLVMFSFMDQTRALLVMRIAGVLLLIINLAGIFRLRHEIDFTIESQPVPIPATK